MKTSALIALVLVGIGMLAACAAAPQPEDETILTPAQRATCEEEGGCITITRKALRSLVDEVAKAARKGAI